MISEIHVMEELRNIVLNAPVPPGSTLSHATANECVRRGWAERNSKGDFVPATKGRMQYIVAGSADKAAWQAAQHGEDA